MLRLIPLVVVAIGAISPVHAQLTSEDFFDPAGTLIVGGVTRDAQTDLDWLDLSITVNQFSYNEMLAGAGPGVGWVNDDWRYATLAEVCSLFSRYAGGIPDPCEGPFGLFGTPAESASVVALLGPNAVPIPPDPALVRGLFDDGDASSQLVGVAVLTAEGFINVDLNARFPDNIDSDGHFLVRPAQPIGEQEISISPTNINFGDVDLFSVVGATLTITNIGNSDLTISGMSIDPLDAGFGVDGFVCTGDCPPLPGFPITLAPGESAAPVTGVDNIAFFPTLIGVATATLSIMSDDLANPVIDVELIGNGIFSGPQCNNQVATIGGTNGPDVIIGTNGDDVIDAMDGADLIRGRGGNDIICGGPGNDLIFGNSGDDLIFGEAGDDTLSGAGGTDTLNGGLGSDVLQGGRDNDSIIGNEGNDRLFGGGGSDTLFGDSGDDFLIGNGDDDLLFGGDDTDICDNSQTDVVQECELTRN